MINIKDLEEKKRIITLYKCRFNSHPQNHICNSHVYDIWLRRWRDDFVVNGKCLKLWHQKFVVSAKQHRKRIPAPDYYAEYNMLINSVTAFVNEIYNLKKLKSKNVAYSQKILEEYRKKCKAILQEELKHSSKTECKLIHTNPRKLMTLAEYEIRDESGVLFSGSFDEATEFIKDLR